MKRILRSAWILVMLFGVCTAHAALVQVAPAPARTRATVTNGVTLSIQWRIATTPTHVDGATSDQGIFVNATTGAALASVPVIIGTRGGVGPLIYPELISVAPDEIRAWRAQGVKRIGYRRLFTSVGGSAVTGQVLIDIGAPSTLSAPRDGGLSDDLTVLRLDLEFADGARIAVVDRNETLRARVTLSYSGTGTLRGRWQVAEPGSAGAPFFRTLDVVRELISAPQRTTLTSPALPTHTSGRYLLRFCVDDDASAASCTADTGSVQTVYEVGTEDAVALLRGVTPNGRKLGALDELAWPRSTGAAMYQIQIFRPHVLPTVPSASTDPDLVTGQLIQAPATRTTLTQLVRSRLQAGERYLWRVTAHDADGRLLARSEVVSFIYAP